MFNLSRAARAKSGTAPASFTDRLVDHRYSSSFIKLDGRVCAEFDAGLTPCTNIRIDPANGRGDLHLAQCSQGKSFGRRTRCLGDRISNILGRLTGPCQKYPVRCSVQGSQLGVFFQEKPVCALVDTKNPTHLNRILAGFHGDTKDHHIHRHAQTTSQKRVFGNGDKLAFLFWFFCLVSNFSHFTSDEGGPFFLAP